MGRLTKVKNWFIISFTQAIVAAIISSLLVTYATIYLMGTMYENLTLFDKICVGVIYAFTQLIIVGLVVFYVKAQLALSRPE